MTQISSEISSVVRADKAASHTPTTLSPDFSKDGCDGGHITNYLSNRSLSFWPLDLVIQVSSHLPNTITVQANDSEINCDWWLRSLLGLLPTFMTITISWNGTHSAFHKYLSLHFRK